jgi:hypothetical protein
MTHTGMTPDVRCCNPGRKHWRLYAVCRLCLLAKIWQPPFPVVQRLCSLALGKRGCTGVECICAEIVMGGVLYWANPAARTSLPFSSHKLSGFSMTDIHWPRDTNPLCVLCIVCVGLKSLHEACETQCKIDGSKYSVNSISCSSGLSPVCSGGQLQQPGGPQWGSRLQALGWNRGGSLLVRMWHVINLALLTLLVKKADLALLAL